MKIGRLKFKRILTTLILGTALMSCQADVPNRVGVSSSGFIIGIDSFHGNSGLIANGSSQATIRVEVFTTAGQVVNGQQVTLTTTLGTLALVENNKVVAADGTVTTNAADDNISFNGVVLATLTAGSEVGTAYVTATVQNVSATTAVPIVQFTGSVN